MTSLADVLKAHHDKLDEHTKALVAIEIRLTTIEDRLTSLEGKSVSVTDFLKPLEDWLSQVGGE